MVDERDERTRETDHTTVVTEGGGGGGAGTALAVVLALVLIVVVLLLVFGGWVGDRTDEVDIPEEVGVNIDIDQPAADSPDLAIPEPDTPPPADGNTG